MKLMDLLGNWSGFVVKIYCRAIDIRKHRGKNI